jgi:hypothetical protein
MAKQRSWKDNPTKTSLKSKMSSNQLKTIIIKTFKDEHPLFLSEGGVFLSEGILGEARIRFFVRNF